MSASRFPELIFISWVISITTLNFSFLSLPLHRVKYCCVDDLTFEWNDRYFPACIDMSYPTRDNVQNYMYLLYKGSSPTTLYLVGTYNPYTVELLYISTAEQN